ncbi:hypothetical protein ACKI2N_007505 [Cupriavidus sp. 30B13]|uniref:hypothetical protein n=1 Tax=Cupriavidus sp. 30B13 TaxID=3384241 RepID=UPI003B91E5E8
MRTIRIITKTREEARFMAASAGEAVTAGGGVSAVLEGGRLRGARDLALAQHEELLAGCHAVIVAAFGDVDKALNAIAGLDAQMDAQGEALHRTTLPCRRSGQ